jgi:hypothetical protein
MIRKEKQRKARTFADLQGIANHTHTATMALNSQACGQEGNRMIVIYVLTP